MIIREINAWRQSITVSSEKYSTHIQQCAKVQHNIGWKNFLEGLIGENIIDQQQKYYSLIRSRRTGTAWAHKIIRYNWTFIHEIWTHRNNKLHAEDSLQSLEYSDTLKEAVTKEWEIGLSRLPTLEFNHLFARHTSPITIMKSLESAKSWFSTVRSGRILYNDTIVDDEFNTKGPLQHWVGLDDSLFPSKLEFRYIQELQQSIMKEMQHGLHSLPTDSYQQFFNKPINYIFSLPIQQQKNWFCTVREGRIKHKDNTTSDNFNQRGRLQRWAGLPSKILT